MRNEIWEKRFSVGQRVYLGGCFTFDNYIVDQNLTEIARLMGLPLKVVSQGVFIAHPLRIPSMNEFELGGTTLDSTDKFMDYSGKEPVYQRDKFEKLYAQASVIPVDFHQIKKQYHNIFGAQKLVKIIAPSAKDYPPGGMSPQFVMKKDAIPCRIVKFIPPFGIYKR